LQASHARLVEIDIDRVDLLDRGQQRGGACLHIGPLRDLRNAAAAADRRDDVGITQTEPCHRNGRLGAGDIGRRLLLRSDRVVVLLLADRVAVQEHLVSFGLRAGRGQVGLRLLLSRQRTVECSAILRGIDLVQGLIRLHVGAFLKAALLDDAVDPGADLRDQVGRGTSGKVQADRHAGALDGDDRHLRRRGGWVGLLLRAASGKRHCCHDAGERYMAPVYFLGTHDCDSIDCLEGEFRRQR
jgi:hypothetical protein